MIFFVKAQLSVFLYHAKSLAQMTSPIAIVVIVTLVFVVAEVLADVVIFAAAASYWIATCAFQMRSEDRRAANILRMITESVFRWAVICLLSFISIAYFYLFFHLFKNPLSYFILNFMN